MGKFFGTDGFRGKAGVVLTAEHAFKIGQFLGWYYSKERPAKIVIGKDTRRSSYMYENALSAGIDFRTPYQLNTQIIGNMGFNVKTNSISQDSLSL